MTGTVSPQEEGLTKSVANGKDVFKGKGAKAPHAMKGGRALTSIDIWPMSSLKDVTRPKNFGPLRPETPVHLMVIPNSYDKLHAANAYWGDEPRKQQR